METPSPRTPTPSTVPGHLTYRALVRRHLPLSVRKNRDRAAARARIAVHVRRKEGRGLTPAQQGWDPLSQPRRPGVRVFRALKALLGSSAVHAALVGVGILIGGIEFGRRDIVDQQVTIEVREKPPEPPPPVVEEKPPEPEVIEEAAPVPPKPIPKVAKAPTPAPVKTPPPPPAETPKAPPPRIVGLSLESATEGGSGPAFAVGNTREGQTATRAVAPKDVVKGGTGPATSETREPAPPINQVATRIPTAGVKYTQPKRKNPKQPDYPALLKTQGLEADVPVMISIDATGRVTNVKVIKESPYPEFNEAARKSALEGEYEPATRDGVEIPFTLSFTIRFRLEDQ